MKKESRLSFRISPSMSSKIELAVRKSKGDIRDRSEFGSKAINIYLNHILSNTETDLMCIAILKIADALGEYGVEMREVRNILYYDPITPLENHPKFEELLLLREKLGVKEKKILTKRLFNAKYGELDQVYKEYIEFIK